MFLLIKFSEMCSAVRHTVIDALGQIMPRRSSELIEQTIYELDALALRYAHKPDVHETFRNSQQFDGHFSAH